MRKTKARRRIKGLLEDVGHEYGYELSEGHALYWHALLNEAVFDRMLLTPKILFAKQGGTRMLKRGQNDWYAWCNVFMSRPKDKRSGRHKTAICINPILYEEDLKFFVHILAHEMVHQYEYEYTDFFHSNAHGKTFLEWKPKLRRAVNFPLSAQM